MSSVYIDIIREVVETTFNCDKESITETTGPGDLSQWDSLGHIMLLEALQERFSFELPIDLVIEARTVGELAKVIEEIAPA